MGWGDRQQVQELRGVVEALRRLPRYEVTTEEEGGRWVRWSDVEALIKDVPAAPVRIER